MTYIDAFRNMERIVQPTSDTGSKIFKKFLFGR